MTVQLPLPAGWARNFVSSRDPRERLDELRQAQLDVKAAIRLEFDAMADRFGIKTREVDRAMESVDDTISDLIYEVESDIEGEIIDRFDAD